ncbi:MAG TPA: hypothetical protein VN956_22955 [Pyrinomonadaceae bacterium]|nr:hypothetical protein [Pyrinomonadaceae bacterium]
MKRFTVFPKKGDIFSVTLNRFSVDASERFILYDSFNEASENGYLSFDNLAADCAADQPRPKRNDVRCFEVHLKGRSEPIKIFAHYFKMDPSKGVEFYFWTTGGHELKLEDFYVAMSEVVSITPVGGLTKYVD